MSLTGIRVVCSWTAGTSPSRSDSSAVVSMLQSSVAPKYAPDSGDSDALRGGGRSAAASDAVALGEGSGDGEAADAGAAIASEAAVSSSTASAFRNHAGPTRRDEVSGTGRSPTTLLPMAREMGMARDRGVGPGRAGAYRRDVTEPLRQSENAVVPRKSASATGHRPGSGLDVVDARRPGRAGAPPAALAGDLLRRLPVAVVKTVDVEDAVEVIELVLHDAGAPAVDLDADGLPLQIDARDEHLLGSAEREPLAGEREAPFRLVVGVGFARHEGAHPQLGVDDDPAPRLALVVGVGVRVDPQRNPDLRCRQAHAGRGIHRLEHVRHERADVVGDLLDGRSRCVQNGIAHDANRENGHALSLSRHGCG